MSFFGSAFGASSSLSSDSGWFLRALGMRTSAGTSVSEFSAPKIPAVYACWNRISNPIAGFPLGIFQKDKSGSNSTRVTQHPLSDKLGMRPNPFMSSRTLRKVGQCHALGWGNGYIEIERDQKDDAIALWPLLPWATKPQKRGDALKVRTTIDGKQFELDNDDVIHVMDLSQDGYEGLSPIAMARNALGMALAMEEYGGKFFANDAKSGGFLLHPGKLSSAAKDNLGGKTAAPGNPAASLEKQGGLDNAHRVKVLEEGMKFIQTTIPQDDAQFLQSRDFQIAEIARIYDVPLILLQSQEKSTSWGSGIEQLMIGFVRQTIAPWINAWEQEFNWKLFTQKQREDGMYVKFNMNGLLRGDMAARAAFYREMFSMAGLSPNQILSLEDMDGIGPDGDARFVPANFTTLARAIAGETKPADSTAPGAPAPKPAPAPQVDEDEEEEPAA